MGFLALENFISRFLKNPKISLVFLTIPFLIRTECGILKCNFWKNSAPSPSLNTPACIRRTLHSNLRIWVLANFEAKKNLKNKSQNTYFSTLTKFGKADKCGSGGFFRTPLKMKTVSSLGEVLWALLQLKVLSYSW